VEDIQGRLRSFTRMLLDLLSLRLCDRREADYQHDVLWVLDDMTELRYLAMIERLTAYLRGYGHLLLGGTQSFAQLWQWFGRFSGVLNNTAAWVLFRPNHYDEAKVIADNLGSMTVMEPADRVTQSAGGGSRSMGMQSHGRQLMTPDELRYDLGDDEVIVCVGGKRPMRVSRGPLGRVA
jgi:type IV secretory pathway TraG/TraD family ATPase VirD4